MRIIVLGGAGKMGCITVQDLAKDERVDEVILADMNMTSAKAVSDYLQSPKIRIQQVDINDTENLVAALKGSDACVNATIRHTNLQVMRACIRAGTHYNDMGGLFFVTRKQMELYNDFLEAGLSAVLGMGSAPGVPNIQARYAADRLDSIESIKIYDGIKPPPTDEPLFTYSVPTIVDELTMEPMVYREEKFVACEPLSEFEDYWFSYPVGLLPMHLSLHSEVATLPLSFKDKGVKECFFKINYWGMSKQVVEKIRVLADFGFGASETIIVNGNAVVPREVMVQLLSGYVPPITSFLEPASKQPPDWTKEIVTEVKGMKDGKAFTYRLGTLTCQGALPTGVAPAITAIWQAENRIPAGAHPPELVIDPVPFFMELEQRQIYTQVTHTSMI
ncbi:MAG: saccharopine dehydrogenase NADP-binding domain-containing protein [Anaerolineales bacterium]|nr:MAG: saccharopine dehydrogenase NADP-binding domain-containing protein [Anaerolineales bacterium]